MKLGNISVRKDQSGRSVAFFCKDPSVGVTKKLINAMLDWSKWHNNCDLRVCLHQSRNDRFHEMIILHHRGIYRRPHKETRQESCHVLCGKMTLFLFSADGRVSQRTILDNKHTFVYRIGREQWHTSVPLTPTVIFHEAKSGPFVGNETTFAPWAPADQKQGSVYSKKLLDQ